ncbi:methylated-DNA--[protein]-cysteine S-methyltransferase [Microbacterium sp.]|uniref:methylated-DNA--[protein]-cysteine S-methyltransferase n=1 Tax=Microbacterium sp. TaxID=51671 RepID=UPI003C74457B
MIRSAAYSVHPTPIGEALVVVADEGLAFLHLLEVAVGAREAALADIAGRLSAVPVPDDDATAVATTQLDEYFAGIRRGFDLPLDLGTVDGFARRALEAIREIPYGETASYGEVAIMAGSPGAHRAAGSACARTPLSIVLPVHRVVRSDGSIGEYGGHPERKRFLLDLEAHAIAAAPASATDSTAV